MIMGNHTALFSVNLELILDFFWPILVPETMQLEAETVSAVFPSPKAVLGLLSKVKPSKFTLYSWLIIFQSSKINYYFLFLPFPESVLPEDSKCSRSNATKARS